MAKVTRVLKPSIPQEALRIVNTSLVEGLLDHRTLRTAIPGPGDVRRSTGKQEVVCKECPE